MSASTPNICVICVDQMQSFCLGVHDHPDVRTPNLDALARSGTSFRRAYCANSVCMPARASMITGLTPRQHGVVTNGTNLSEDVPTVGAALAAAGWRTHAAGKLHLNAWAPGCYVAEGAEARWSWEDKERWNHGEIEELPLPYFGFQSVDLCGGHVDYCFGDYRRWLEREHPGVWDGYQPPPGEHVAPECWPITVPDALHYNTWITERSAAFIDDVAPGQPFFLWCSFPDPHHPFAACPEYRALFDASTLTLPPGWHEESDLLPLLAARRAHYRFSRFDEDGLRAVLAETYGMIAHIDACVGRLMQALERSGRAEDTVVVFVADHGEQLGAHHLLGKHAWHYEQLVRVPFLWRVPGGVAGQLRDEVVSQLDLVPTLLELAGMGPEALERRPYGGFRHGGISTPPGLPGRSLAPALRAGASLEPRPALIEFDDDNAHQTMVRMRTLIDGDWKLTYYGMEGAGILIDLANDPEERHNRFDDPACADRRATMLEALLRTVVRSDRLDPPPAGPS